MAEREERDWSNVVSGQIAVYKTDKALLELMDNLKPASYLFPAHIHASGDVSEVGERSLIRLNMLDYSKGTGDNTVSVYANISPEEAKYIYSALFNHLWEFDYPQEKILVIQIRRVTVLSQNLRLSGMILIPRGINVITHGL